jgi:DNA-binding Lrp family transcriptional regulator
MARSRTSPAPLDDASKAIIEQLQQDGRRPYATIGKAVGLSEAAVRQRVQKLHDMGIMQIVAVTDPTQVGFTRSAMIGITVQGDVDAVADKLEKLPEIAYMVVVAKERRASRLRLCRRGCMVKGAVAEIQARETGSITLRHKRSAVLRSSRENLEGCQREHRAWQ